MNQRERDKAKRELKHALDALEDGAGRELWGPAIVGRELSFRNLEASVAFDAAAMCAWDLLGARSREQCIKHVRALAPVMLDLLLGEQPDTD